MKSVTRDIDPAKASGLLERAPRACLAFAGEDGPAVLPAMFVLRDGRYFAGLADGNGPLPNPGLEAVLLVDEGVHWFELRAVSLRGFLRVAEAPPDSSAGYAWFELEPARIGAWDYSQLRELSNGD
jgi:hypothetical protein